MRSSATTYRACNAILTIPSSVIPGGQQSAPALKYLSQGTDDHKFTWKVDIEAGTQVTLKVLDNTGYAAFSAPVSVSRSGNLLVRKTEFR